MRWYVTGLKGVNFDSSAGGHLQVPVAVIVLGQLLVPFMLEIHREKCV